MKKTLYLFLLLLIPSTAFAGNYTSSDINKNDSYQRILAIEYAAEHITNPNLVYPYYGHNCTNFVSQCLYSGGMPQSVDASYPDTRQWYMRRKFPSWNHSNTWTVAHDFRYHWANVNNVEWNRCYQYKIYSSAYALRTNDSLWNDLYNRCSGGDVIQYVYGFSNDLYGRTIILNSFIGVYCQTAAKKSVWRKIPVMAGVISVQSHYQILQMIPLFV